MADQSDFLPALEALCRQHHVRLAPTTSGHIGVFHPEPGQPTLLGIVNRTVPERAGAGPRLELPTHFATHAEAKKHPGYLGFAMAHHQADTLNRQYPGSAVVPIGVRPGRGFVIVDPKAKA